MKSLTPVLLLCFLLISSSVFSQKEICKNIYVWDFTNENNQKNQHTKMLMQEVEDALTNTSCRVLQRRNYASLSEQIDNENAIQTIEGMSSTISNELQSIKAETVLFGKVQMDFSGNIMLNVSFQNLLTKEILKSESLMLAGEEAHNMGKRRQKIASFISHCVGPKLISNEETNYWQQVQQLGTPEAYKDYLTKYPGGQFRSRAETILADQVVWKEIQADGKTSRKIKKLITYTENPQAHHYQDARSQLEDLLWSGSDYAKYIQYFPSGKHAAEVQERYEEKLYGQALGRPSYYAEDYLEAFPNGKYVEQVKAKYEDTLYADAVKSPKFKVEDYIEQFPEGKYLSKLDDVFWNAEIATATIPSTFSYKRYLKLFPNGKHAKEAKSKVGKYD